MNIYQGGYYFWGGYFGNRATIPLPTETSFTRVGPDAAAAIVSALSTLPDARGFAVFQSTADPSAAIVATGQAVPIVSKFTASRLLADPSAAKVVTR